MTRLLLLAAALALGAPLRAAPPADVADLFPPGTLAYAELHAPADLAPQFAALVKGTPLADGVAFVHEKRAAAKTVAELRATEELAAVALLAAPEVLAEFGKLRGVAVGVVGFGATGEPEAALAVLTGDSAAFGLAARALVTAAPNVRKVAEVGKVPVYQFRAPAVNYDNTGRPVLDTSKPPAEGARQATFAHLPGLFVAGTSRAAVGAVVQRFTGDARGSLRDAAGFRAAAAEFRKPGLFFYASAPDLFAALDAAGRARGDVAAPEWLTALRVVAGDKALKHVAGRAHFRDGGLAVECATALDPAHTSALAALLAGGAAQPELLAHARRPAIGAVAVALPPKDRAAALTGFLDALAKAGGEIGRLPGEALKELEAEHKVPVRDVLLGKVRAVTVAVPVKQELPKGAVPLPVFVLHTEDAATATAWEEALPKLVSVLAGDAPARPSSEPVGGVKVLSLPGTGLPWKAPVHYARAGTRVAVGLDRKLVGGALAADAAGAALGEGAFGLPRGDRAAVGALNVGPALAELFAPPAGPTRNEPPPLDANGTPVPEEVLKGAAKARAAFFAAFDDLPPLALGARASGTEVRFELFQPRVQNGGLTPVLAAGADWLVRALGTGASGPGAYPRFRRFR